MVLLKGMNFPKKLIWHKLWCLFGARRIICLSIAAHFIIDLSFGFMTYQFYGFCFCDFDLDFYLNQIFISTVYCPEVLLIKALIQKCLALLWGFVLFGNSALS